MEPYCGGLALCATASEPTMMVLREAGEADLAAVLPLMQQLRPHLTSVGDFAQRGRRMSDAGYGLLAMSLRFKTPITPSIKSLAR